MCHNPFKTIQHLYLKQHQIHHTATVYKCCCHATAPNFSDFTLNRGENSLNVDCDFIQPDKKATVKFEIRTVEKQEKIVLNI